MAVAETSRKAYNSIRDLGDKQYQVHQTIGEMGIASNQDIADRLGWPINQVTGRVNELAKYGFIEVHGLAMGRFGSTVKTWHCVNPNDRKLKEMASE